MSGQASRKTGESPLQRREFVTATGTSLLAVLAGCLGDDDGIGLNVESPAGLEQAVELFYRIPHELSDADTIEQAYNTLVHTEGVHYPWSVEEDSWSQRVAEMDVSLDGVDVEETDELEEVSFARPTLATIVEIGNITEKEIIEAQLTLVDATPQYTGSDAPQVQTYRHYVATEDGEWRLLR